MSILVFSPLSYYTHVCWCTGECDPLVEPPGETSVQSLRYKVGKVQDLRSEIDKLRELVSNKYAEDMGENLTCVTH